MKRKDGRRAAELSGDNSLVTGAQGMMTISKDRMEKMTRDGDWTLDSYDFEKVEVTTPAPDVAIIAYVVHQTVTMNGRAQDMRWFKGPNRCHMHTFNAYSDGNKVILYAPFWDGNFFPFFPNVDGTAFNPAKARAFIRKFTLDLDSASDAWQEELLWDMPVVDIGKVDPRTLSLQSRYIYTSFNDPNKPYDRDRAGPHAPASVANSYGRFDVQTRRIERYFAGSTHALQECSFVPRGNTVTNEEIFA